MIAIRRTIALAFFILALAAVPAAADIVAPGQKSVTHELVFQGLDAYPQYQFWLYDPAWVSHVKVVLPDEPISFYHLIRMKLVAVPRDAAAGARFERIVAASEPFGLDTSASAMSPIAKRVTYVRVGGIEGERILVAESRTVELNASGQPATRIEQVVAVITYPQVAAVLVGVALLLMVVFIRRRRSARAIASGDA